MVKFYFTYTAIVEAITGLGLIFVPATVAHILLGAELAGTLSVVLAMVGGAAICSIALLSWLSRSGIPARFSLPVLLLYNIAVSLILLYATLEFGYHGIPIYGVIIFHLFQSLLCVVFLKK
ncbi:MAG TPA: hypothetical protein VK772_04450 [Puia sp.]|jgi:hypothetical protein|nr:hypothetical protein [Puia sp.]